MISHGFLSFLFPVNFIILCSVLFIRTVQNNINQKINSSQWRSCKGDGRRPNGSACFPAVLEALCGKALKLVLIINFVLKGFIELGPLLVQ